MNAKINIFVVAVHCVPSVMRKLINIASTAVFFAVLNAIATSVLNNYMELGLRVHVSY